MSFDLLSDLLGKIRVAAPPTLPEYIVLDHAMAAGASTQGIDAKGRRYFQCSPSVLDAMKHKPAGRGLGEGIDPLVGFPVYRRESLVEGWPDDLGAGPSVPPEGER